MFITNRRLGSALLLVSLLVSAWFVSVRSAHAAAPSLLGSRAGRLATHFMSGHFRAPGLHLYGVHERCSGSATVQTCHFSGSLQNDNITATIVETLHRSLVSIVAQGTVINPMDPSAKGRFTKHGTLTLAPRHSPTRCVNLRLGATTTHAWESAWIHRRDLEGLRLHRAPGAFYGRCGTTEYGRAYFDPDRGQRLTERQQTNEMDGPDVFVRRGSGAWKDVSDSGGGVPCSPPLTRAIGYPPALVRVWHLSCAA
jgi:hypothetical protein